MTSWLLWALVAIGAWNALNFIGRIYYGEMDYGYVWTILVGLSAAACLALE